ncbi:hypothetical protein B9Z55_012385 [Caenorhabditis nigoni]|uniref:RING-type domain-containing protein n=1 Tax=Caenorhabditis nigoni TaxID=1611254 RepID=A0A2G5TX20_9PELO|nr:hypothetical protein B9Z55_012385 [Caenorhabditis nigoni]
MDQPGTKKHNDTQLQFFETKDEIPLLTSSALLKLPICDELEAMATMFYVDYDDVDKYNKMKIREYMTSLDKFVKNVNPDKKFYLRQLPVLMSMADKEPRFFMEEVNEIVFLLLRRSSDFEGLEKLQKYEETLFASSSDETVPKVSTLTEVNKLFEDFDIDKGLVTITPDIEYSEINDCRRGYVKQLYISDRQRKQFVYPAQAIHNIFNQCVLGLNWTTNICKKHLDCNDSRRKKVLELMNKYTSSSMNLISLEDVQFGIDILHIAECHWVEETYFSDNNYLYKEYMNDQIVDLDLYKTAIKSFHLPKNGPLAELHTAPVQGIRLSILLGWIIQFIGPIDKGNEFLANVLVSNLECSIEKDVEKTVEFMRREVVVRGKAGKRKIFKPYGAQKDNHNQSKYEKMAEKARLRKQAVQQKKNKKGGKQNPENKNEGSSDDPDTNNQWKDLSDEPIEYTGSMSKEEIYRSKVTIKGHTYGSNYALLKNGPRKENPQKFFLIDIDELQKLIDMESMMGFEWTKDEKYLEDLESFVKLTGIKKFVIRHLRGDRTGSERWFLLEEALEITRICSVLRGDDPKKHDLLDELAAEVLILGEHVREARSMVQIDTLFNLQKIDKSTITVIPDFVGKMNETNSTEHIYTPVTTIARKGECLMFPNESALYIFKNVICGINWMEAIEMHGIDVYRNFQQVFEDTLKPLFCAWEMCYIARDWHEDAITKLKNHKIFENQRRADINFFEDFAEDSLVPTSYFSEQCKAFDLPPMPGNLPSGMLVKEAKVLMMMVWACQFYPHQENSMVQRDRGKQRAVILSVLFERLPQGFKWANVINHWSGVAKTTISHEPNKTERSTEELDEVAGRELDRALVVQKRQRKEKNNEGGVEAHEALESLSSTQSAPEDAEDSSGKPPKLSEHQEGSLVKTGKAQKPNEKTKASLKKSDKSKEPEKEVEDNSKKQFSKKSKNIPESSTNEGPDSSMSLQRKSKTPAISKESSRSPSTSISETCSSQKPVPEDEILENQQKLLDKEAMEKKKFEDQEKKMVKMQNQIKELKDQVKQLSEENETLKSSIEERREGDSNKLRKAKKELEKEKEKTAKLEQAIKDWKVSLEFMEKDLIEAGEQRDIANEKLRKADEELREQTAKNLENQLKEANKTLAMMNKEKDTAVQRVVREWTERWNVERHQVQLAQNRTEEAESKARQLMKENAKLLERDRGDGSNLPAHVATYKEDIRKLRQLLREKEDLIPHLQKRVQELSNQPGPSSQVSEDPNEYLERIRNMLEIINRDDSIEEKRVRISRLLTNTDSAETRQISVLEEDLFDASVTMYRDTLNYNKYKVQQTQSTSECQPIPPYPDLSERFLDAENKERMKPMFGEGDCAICFVKIEEHEEERTCPNEICALRYHGKCILKSIETMPFCPYCKTHYFNVDDFPVLS